jgi:U4/U6 small nuclear ribonucleoprotein PRP4
MQEDPLLLTRKSIALHSLERARSRIHAEQQAIQKYDETELDEQFDELVYSNTNFENICTEYGDSSCVTCGKFSSDGGYYVTVGASGEGKVWNTRDEKLPDFAKEVTLLKGTQKLCDVDIHPGIGNIPSFAPNIIAGLTTGEITVWTFDPSLSSQKSITIKAHSDRVNAIRFHQSAAVFLTGSYDKSWSIWDSSRIKELSNQKGHSKEIHTMSLHPDGSLVLTGDLGGEGMIWDLRTGRGIYNFSSTNSILCSCFSPNGFECAISGRNNLISILDIRRKKVLK